MYYKMYVAAYLILGNPIHIFFYLTYKSKYLSSLKYFHLTLYVTKEQKSPNKFTKISFY